MADTIVLGSTILTSVNLGRANTGLAPTVHSESLASGQQWNAKDTVALTLDVYYEIVHDIAAGANVTVNFATPAKNPVDDVNGSGVIKQLTFFQAELVPNDNDSATISAHVRIEGGDSMGLAASSIMFTTSPCGLHLYGPGSFSWNSDTPGVTIDTATLNKFTIFNDDTVTAARVRVIFAGRSV